MVEVEVTMGIQRKRNSLKICILEVLARQGPQRVMDLGVLARGTSRNWQNVYRSVARYAKWGLVARYRGRDGRLGVEITERGLARLRWLEGHGMRR